MNVKINSTGGLSVGDATNGYKDLATKEYVDNKTFTVSWDDVSGKPNTFTPSSHNHSAADINSGTLDIARIPTGTSSTTVSLGNHTHSDYVATTGHQSVSGIKKFNTIYVGTNPLSSVSADISINPGFTTTIEGSNCWAQFSDNSNGYLYVFSDDCGTFYYQPANEAEYTLKLPKSTGTFATQQWVSGNYALASAIAPAYDSTKTYSVGDAVTTSGSLWKCTTAVTTAEAFDSTKWQNVSLLREMLCDIVYPVGSIYTSVNSTSPATLFGGTWERITGCFLLAATDNGESGASQAAGNTGGSATHTLTAAQLPKITGSFRLSDNNVLDTPSSTGVREGSGALSIASATHPQRQSTHSAGLSAPTTTHVTKVNLSFGSGTAHNNMPPYLAVYVWKRTA